MMAVYAIGDIQGCFNPLLRLMELIQFDDKQDTLWLAGDLVNRGPHSAEVLRFIRRYDSSIKVVLGNHDLHLLAVAVGVSQYHLNSDTITSVLQADDCDVLIDWLRHQSLFHHDAQLAFSMVHAGVPPQWSIKTCIKRAKEVEAVLQSDNWQQFFHHIYGNKPSLWSDDLTGWQRLRYIINCFTRLRYVYHNGQLAFAFKGNPSQSSVTELPWFDVPDRKTKNDNIVFGHWSTLGAGRYGNAFSMDGGAVWGGQLMAMRIDCHPYKWWSIDADS